jgi:DNA-binding GntR family transcriptional regulator
MPDDALLFPTAWTGEISMPAPRKSASRSPAAADIPPRDALRKAILDGVYLPGERLVETSLCERFGTSRFIIRAALVDLAAEGLVDVQRNRGAHVRKISFDEAIEITEVRMVLEGLVAARAAALVTDEQASELDEIALLMRRAVAADEFRRYSELNQRLHRMIQTIAGHDTADRLIKTMRAQLVRHQYTLSLLPGRPAASLPQHERIIEAIQARSPKAAEEAMRDHIASVIEAMRNLEAVGLS